MRQSTLYADEAFRKAVIADETMQTLIGTKYFPLAAPDGTDGDYIIYGTEGFESEGTQHSAVRETLKIEVDCVSPISYDNAKAILAQLARICIRQTNNGKETRLVDVEQKALAYADTGATTHIMVAHIELIDY